MITGGGGGVGGGGGGAGGKRALIKEGRHPQILFVDSHLLISDSVTSEGSDIGKDFLAVVTYQI